MAVESKNVGPTYKSLPVVAESAQGSWIIDVNGEKYLDFLAGYSANNFGHHYAPIMVTLHEQADRLAFTSRAIMNDKLGKFATDLCELAGKELMIPMNTGAEAVETGIKALRKWGHDVKGVEDGKQNIIVAKNNFHGRTTTIVGFSSDEATRRGFRPATPGFRPVTFGDVHELVNQIDDNTVGVLIEPVQGEAGVIIPPDDYLPAVRQITRDNNMKLVFDEVQSGFARTGKTLAAEHWSVEPDAYLLGKALGGGVFPVSAMVGDADLVGSLREGEHGSTFGGMPLAAAIGSKVVELMNTGWFQQKATEQGEYLGEWLDEIISLDLGVLQYRRLGLWAGVDIDPSLATGEEIKYMMAERHVIIKETHGSTERFSPPLNISRDEIDFAMDAFIKSLKAAANK